MEVVLLPILLFAVCGTFVGIGLLAASRILSPRRAGAVKEMPYESGMDPIHDARRRFDVRFYLVAIMFLLFDVELLFLYPWAVASRDSHGIDELLARTGGAVGPGRWFIFGEAMVFIGFLAAGLVYAWRKGVLRWR
jgi:NADH-quinone oxidoreductase subunit A